MNDALLAKLLPIQEATGIADILDFRARSHGEKEAVVCGTERLTYNTMRTRARAVAHQLAEMGVQKGDRVGAYLPNGADYIATFFGTSGMDAVVVPINPLLKPDEVAHILSDSQAKAIVLHADLLPIAIEALHQATEVRSLLIASENSAMVDVTAVPKHIKVAVLDRNRAPESLQWPLKVSSPDLPAVIIYTSGTTGKPKGAVLTHSNLITSYPSRLEIFDVDENDRLFAALPMCHIFGMAVVILGTIAKGATIVVQPKFEARAALELIEKERITLVPAVPAMFQMMLYEQKQSPCDVNTLRLLFSGAAPMPVKVIAELESQFGAVLVEGYGLTETAAAATINPLHGKRKAGTVGPALPGIRVEIFDENGKILPPGEENVGEIAISGSNVMVGYHGQVEATSEVLKDGWFLTGDLGYKDEDGYFCIVGRKKELIIRGGSNVYPAEVEQVILKLPGVIEAAVIGIPDEVMGERVKAVIVSVNPQITEDIVKEHCEKHLAHYKVPRIVEFTKALPRNSTGKVVKRMLK